MRLRWEKARAGVYYGFLDDHDTRQLAQVAHVVAPGGTDSGWLVWLVGQPDVLDYQPATVDDAMQAAEAALDVLR